MAKVQRVSRPDGRDTVTVVGDDFLPVASVDEYLCFLRDGGYAPNTVRSYAAGLATWWTYLESVHADWLTFSSATFGGFLRFLRSGEAPGITHIGQPQQYRSESTVQSRSAAVMAFYRYQADAHGQVEPYDRLYSQGRTLRRSHYRPLLDGIAPRSIRSPLYRTRRGNTTRPPILEPGQVQIILDACASWRGDRWDGSLAGIRDRLLFAVLAETGMRLGEALSLRHCDFRLGAGDTPRIEVVPRQDHPHGMRVKSGRPRTIFIGDDLESLYSSFVWELVDAGADLETANLGDHFVFVNVVRGPRFAALRAETIYTRVRSISTRNQEELPMGWSPHWMRHTHATALLLSGCPPHVVMRRLGHQDVQTTLALYGWVTDEAEMRSVAQWKNYVAGWKGINAQRS